MTAKHPDQIIKRTDVDDVEPVERKIVVRCPHCAEAFEARINDSELAQAKQHARQAYLALKQVRDDYEEARAELTAQNEGLQREKGNAARLFAASLLASGRYTVFIPENLLFQVDHYELVAEKDAARVGWTYRLVERDRSTRQE